MRFEGSSWYPSELQKREGTGRRILCSPQPPIWELDPYICTPYITWPVGEADTSLPTYNLGLST